MNFVRKSIRRRLVLFCIYLLSKSRFLSTKIWRKCLW